MKAELEVAAVWISVLGTLPQSLRRQFCGALDEERYGALVGEGRGQRHFGPGDHFGNPGGDLDEYETDGRKPKSSTTPHSLLGQVFASSFKS